jgi:SnoaL-like domain
MHPNARLIEILYCSLRDNKPDAAAACYAPDAHFEDIAFRLEGRECILQMWSLVCSQKVGVTFASVVADDQQGGASWVAKYMITETRRKVINPTTSHFVFRDGLIVNHVDRCDAMAWATQAFPFPLNLAFGSIGPLRHLMARKKLERFIEENRSRDTAPVLSH